MTHELEATGMDKYMGFKKQKDPYKALGIGKHRPKPYKGITASDLYEYLASLPDSDEIIDLNEGLPMDHSTDNIITIS